MIAITSLPLSFLTSVSSFGSLNERLLPATGVIALVTLGTSLCLGQEKNGGQIEARDEPEAKVCSQQTSVS